VEEFQLSSRPELMKGINGRSLADMQFGRHSGALVLAIRSPEGEDDESTSPRGSAYSRGGSTLIANPGGDVRLAPGQLLVVLGSKEQLERFEALLGPALEGSDPMAN
jgi:voltage-gated potassium channel